MHTVLFFCRAWGVAHCSNEDNGSEKGSESICHSSDERGEMVGESQNITVYCYTQLVDILNYYHHIILYNTKMCVV